MTDDKRPDKKFALGDSLVPLFQQAMRTRIPLLLSGDSGLGKSQFVRDFAAASGLRLVVLNLALFESPAELLGLPVVEGGVTRYRRPALLPDSGAGILLIEEATRSAPHVMAPFYEFLTSRRIGDYELPPGWSIAACMNPPGPDYDGQPFDRAMRDRFLHVDVVADLPQWLSWAERQRLHPRLLATLRADARLFLLASPRSWERVALLLRDAEQHGMDPTLLERVLASVLRSPEAAHAVVRCVPDAAEPAIVPTEVLARYASDATLQQAVHSLLQRGRTDSIERLVFAVEQLLGEPLAGLIATNAFDLESLERFARDVPGDRGAGLLQHFADNEVAGRALAIEPDQALIGYKKSRLFRSVGQWLSQGLGHRVRIAVRRVIQLIERLDTGGGRSALRGVAVRKSLAEFCEHTGDAAAPLQRALQRQLLAPDAAESA